MKSLHQLSMVKEEYVEGIVEVDRTPLDMEAHPNSGGQQGIKLQVSSFLAVGSKA